MVAIPRLLQDILLISAAQRPQHVALVAGVNRLRYGEIADWACRLAHALRARGVRRGDRVVIFMDNRWECAASIFGVLLAGGVFVAVNSQTKAQKLAFILRDSGARALLTEQSLARVFASAVKQVAALALLCVSDGDTLPASAEDLAVSMSGHPAVPPPQAAIGLDLAALIYTSGTTGHPNGVMHTHQSLLFALDSINEYLGFSPDDRLFSILPLNFGYGLFLSLIHI